MKLVYSLDIYDTIEIVLSRFNHTTAVTRPRRKYFARLLEDYQDKVTRPWDWILSVKLASDPMKHEIWLLYQMPDDL